MLLPLNAHSKSKSLLALVLAISLASTGCSAQWINIALQDLPVLTQMALNIATLAGTFSDKPKPADLAAIQNISAQASRDLNLLLTLYNEYKASPGANALEKIQSAIAQINQHLPALLEAGHISNAVLTARVTAAVNLILATVNSFAALIPSTTPAWPSSRPAARRAVTSLPRVSDLKRQWNQQVCVPFDPANSLRSACVMR